jgi:hypothetical protein
MVDPDVPEHGLLVPKYLSTSCYTKRPGLMHCANMNTAELINQLTNTSTVGNREIGAYLSFLLVKKVREHAGQEQQYSLLGPLACLICLLGLTAWVGKCCSRV